MIWALRSLNSGKERRFSAAAAIFIALALSGCNTETVLTHGAVISQDQIDLVPVGSSRDQVLLALGTPSTTGNFGNEVYYYITQKSQRKFAYSKSEVIDQRVFAVYFDEASTVARVGDYGLKDGRVFDFITRATPTGGRDLTFLGQLLAGPGKGASPINPLPPSGVPGSKI